MERRKGFAVACKKKLESKELREQLQSSKNRRESIDNGCCGVERIQISWVNDRKEDCR